MDKPKIVSTSSDETETLIREYLLSHASGVLATADTAGNVSSRTVYYQVSEDLRLTIITKKETQKYKDISENASCSLTIFDEAEQSALDISGQAHEVNDPDLRTELINNMTNQSLLKSGRLIPPADKLIAGDYAVIRVTPRVMRLAVFARPNEDDSVFEKIIFE